MESNSYEKRHPLHGKRCICGHAIYWSRHDREYKCFCNNPRPFDSYVPEEKKPVKFKYIEIIETSTGEIVKRMDVTTKSERDIDRAINGILINMNLFDFFVDVREYETEQTIIR